MIFSLFSYIWLLIILILISPNRVEVWEAGTTLAFIPVIILCSYAAEKGWLDLLFCQGTDNKVTGLAFINSENLMQTKSTAELCIYALSGIGKSRCFLKLKFIY